MSNSSNKGLVLISLPSHLGTRYRQSQSTVDKALGYLIKQGYHGQIDEPTGPNQADNRNESIEKAQKLGVDWIIFIDDDMVCRPDHIVRLIQRDKDICGGLCVLKTWPYNPTVKQWRNQGEQVCGETADKDGFYQMDFNIGDLVECDATGSAFLLIRMSVFDKMEKPYFRYGVLRDESMGHDYHFCKAAKKVGFRIFVDTSVQIGHLGFYPFSIMDAIQARQGREPVYGEIFSDLGRQILGPDHRYPNELSGAQFHNTPETSKGDI